MRPVASGDAVVRGSELFIGGLLLMDLLATLQGGGGQSLWWMDTREMAPLVSTALLAVLAVALPSAAIRPPKSVWRTRVTAASAVAGAVVAAANSVGFFSAWRSGLIDPGVPVPLSLVLVAAFAGIAWWHRPSLPDDRVQARWVGVTAVVAAWFVVFPLAHVWFFGTTDYRRPADAVVVFGARVLSDGRLSSSLSDRVRTAVELYDEGLVDTLIMSGGVGVEGVDEAAAMRDRAVELGVPASAIIVDSDGVNTDATVMDSLEIAREYDFDRLMAVSQFYHLPRIELAYRAQGREVYTVPAREHTSISKTPIFVAREVPGFWVYWGRVLARDVLG